MFTTEGHVGIMKDKDVGRGSCYLINMAISDPVYSCTRPLLLGCRGLALAIDKSQEVVLLDLTLACAFGSGACKYLPHLTTVAAAYGSGIIWYN